MLTAGAVGSTCGLVLQLLEFLPDAKTGVLNALAFKPAVLTMLWRILAAALPQECALFFLSFFLWFFFLFSSVTATLPQECSTPVYLLF